jgi:hypothetical protein
MGSADATYTLNCLNPHLNEYRRQTRVNLKRTHQQNNVITDGVCVCVCVCVCVILIPLL